MREIKFRFWDIGFDCFMPQSDMSALNNKSLIVEQFTGLHDKNGEEIYEGDILESPQFRSYKPTFGIITWDDDNSAWAKFWPIDQFLVIGNIHENPELLK